MRIASVAFTRTGIGLAKRLAEGLASQGDAVRVYGPERLAGSCGVEPYGDLTEWAARAFARADALLFVSAAGIAVRTLAPHVRDKLTDPAVVCVDEQGSFAIPLLSGHVGGANDLARRVARLCGAAPAVTTATDVNGIFAVDEWARSQGLALVERNLAKRVSAALLEGVPVGFASDWPVEGILPTGLVALADATTPVGASTPVVPELGVAVTLDVTSRPFAHTLHLVPQTATVGVGCRRGTTARDILAMVDECLRRARVAGIAVRTLATIDVKGDEWGLVSAAKERRWQLRLHSAQELAAVPGTFSSSEFVRQVVGVDNVCERAACAAGERLLLGKQAHEGVTVAIAAGVPELSFETGPVPRGEGPWDEAAPHATVADGAAHKVVVCVGLGPGGGADLTLRAHEALLAADVIVGYRTYVDLIRDAYPNAEFVVTGMRGEVERCRRALALAAEGRRVAMVCSGDPGIYGMAGLLLELAQGFSGVQVQVVPGVTAANGGAAVLGAPLMHDWCSISLSDLMTPWEVIEARVRAAAQAGLCIVLYNPGSHGRTDHLRRACDVLLECLPAQTVCGMARNIGRDGQTSRMLTLAELRDVQADMFTCVFIGNAQTMSLNGRMVTPRGYLQRGA